MKEFVEPGERRRQQLVEIPGAGDLARDRLQTAELRELTGSWMAVALSVPVAGLPRRVGQRVDELLHLVYLEHLVDVGREQAEDPLHARMRSDHLDARRHRVEERAGGLEVIETQLQTIELEGARIPQVDRRVGVLGDVAPRLVEELAGERDMGPIDEIDLGEIGDVRFTRGVRGGDHRRNDPLEAGLKLLQMNPHAAPVRCDRVAASAVRRWPASGPGVCSKSASQRIVTVNDGQWFIDFVDLRGTPTCPQSAARSSR